LITHANMHVMGAPHCPVALQVCTCVADVHCVSLGLQAPVQAPSMQTRSHAAPTFSHLAESLQRCRCLSWQRRPPGLQSPVQPASKHALGQLVAGPHWPASLQVCTPFPEHWLAFGAQPSGPSASELAPAAPPAPVLPPPAPARPGPTAAPPPAEPLCREASVISTRGSTQAAADTTTAATDIASPRTPRRPVIS
jgi:hypothetical protein